MKNHFKIISGGQTGVDRAALDVALELNLSCGGWCPKGRRAEDGTIDAMYPLQETPLRDYAQRTEWNVRDADALLAFHEGEPAGGTAFAVECSKKYRKPCFFIDFESMPDKQAFHRWLTENNIKSLNVAGPRESHQPGIIYARSKIILKNLLADE